VAAERIVGWAGTIGPATAQVADAILAARPYPENGYRSCLALMRTARKYGAQGTEAACQRAMAIGSRRRKSVEMILARGLDPQPPPSTDDAQPRAPVEHENIKAEERDH
jgi:hypothetical protein